MYVFFGPLSIPVWAIVYTSLFESWQANRCLYRSIRKSANVSHVDMDAEALRSTHSTNTWIDWVSSCANLLVRERANFSDSAHLTGSIENEKIKKEREVALKLEFALK